ncbi:uncharacterized protein LOC141600908 [Silene latifolia]|uniref:uncharacterized protein LOC141600908 n=1 Tax=Silene latifolia TaxID=37657 RepID=UPI003D788E71
MTETINTTADASYSNPYDDPTFVSNSDYAGMLLVNTPFSGKNFMSWSHSIFMALGMKNKQGFLTGTVAMPPVTSPKYQSWLRADVMVRCWLTNSMIPTIKEGYMSCKTEKLLWTDVCERYGQSNAPLLYQLKKDLKNIAQEDAPVVEYFNKLKRHWDDIEELKRFLSKKILDASIKEKVLTFLMGLSDVYDSLRSNILAMDPIPPINKTYSIVQQIESQKMISNGSAPSQDVSALNASKFAGKQQLWNVWKRGDNTKKPKTDDRWCPHCNKKGHVIDSCFIKHPELREKFLAGAATKFSSNVNSKPVEGQFSGYQFQSQAAHPFPAANQAKASTSTQHQAFSTSEFSAPAAPAVQFDPALLNALY